MKETKTTEAGQAELITKIIMNLITMGTKETIKKLQLQFDCDETTAKATIIYSLQAAGADISAFNL